MSTSSNSSQSTSTSEPTFLETPENAIIDRLSGVAAGLAQQMNSWAQGVFAQTSAITNQAVGNFFQVSQKMLGLSNNLTDQYNNTFAPQNASLAKEADSYNSAARQKVNMGMAGATQAQAGDAALKNSEESLRAYGIDPSSGRYAALDKAAAVQNAANVAGAENIQRNNDVATGQRLRSEAVQVGATLPAAIANVNNTAIQANTGASNATLANANTGANLNRLANEYLKTAMDVKLPPTGQRSNSQSTSNGFSSSPGGGDGARSSGGGGGGSPGGGSPGGSGGPAWMPDHSSGQASNAPLNGAHINQGTMAGIRHLNPYGDDNGDGSGWNDPTGQNYDPLSGMDPNTFSGGNQDYYQPQDGYNMQIGQPPAGGYDPWNDPQFGVGNQNPFSDSGFGQTWDQATNGTPTFGNMSGGTDTEWGNISQMSDATPGAPAYDPGWGNTYDQPVATDWGNGADQYAGGGGGGASVQSYDTTSPSSDYYAGDYSAPSDSYDMGGSYARGGPILGAAIPQRGSTRHAYKGPRPSFMADGGAIDTGMSPSGGAQVDDVRAQGPGGQNLRLNADEFVIPDDVAKWKGQEFFQNLIMQSRKKRMTAPAHGQQQPMR